MKINVLTRTSGRPNGFMVNRESVVNQTRSGCINHIVCYDNLDDIKYINESGVNNSIYINDKILDLLKSSFSVVRPDSKYALALYNLYFNEMYKFIKEGWIMFLDDDDCFAHNKVVENIFNKIDDEDTLLIWKMRYFDGKVLPDKRTFGIRPKVSNIGSPCFAFHFKWLEYAKWDNWKGSDFRVVDRLFNKMPRHKWIDDIYVLIGNHHGVREGWGQKGDIIR